MNLQLAGPGVPASWTPDARALSRAGTGSRSLLIPPRRGRLSPLNAARRNDEGDDSMATISKRQAETLWSELREGFVNAEKKIQEIVAARAWEPLGYTSFAAAWAERMAGVRLATDVVKAAVVYALFDTLASTEDVAAALGVSAGVPPSTIERLKHQKDSGVPAELASTRTWGRTKATYPATRPIIIQSVPAETVREYEKLAAEAGSTLTTEAARAVHAHFETLRAAKREVA